MPGAEVLARDDDNLIVRGARDVRPTRAEALRLGDLEQAARGEHRRGDDAAREHLARPRLLSLEARRERQCGDEVSARALAREDDLGAIDVELGRVIDDPREGARHVAYRGWVSVRRREAIVDVEHDVAGAREHERHDPVRVLAEDAKASAVDVEDRALRLGAVARTPYVEPVHGVVAVEDVAGAHEAVLLRASERVERAERGERIKEAIGREHRRLATNADGEVGAQGVLQIATLSARARRRRPMMCAAMSSRQQRVGR